MSPNAFEELDYARQMALALGLHIRNELEDFHVDHVPDNLMPELNSTIRYAIYDFIENVIQDERALGWTVMMIPSYWEVPGRDPKPTFTGEYLWEGKPIPKTSGEGQDDESVGTDEISRQSE